MNLHFSIFWFVLCCFASAIPIYSAQQLSSNQTARIDAVFSQWDKPDSPGCAVAVLHQGEVVYKKGFGLANMEYSVPITPSTIFHVASVSKQFTAAAIAMLALDGKLSL